MHEHIVKSFDQELQLLDKKIAQMGGLAERLLAQGSTPWSSAIPSSPRRRSPATASSTSWSASCRSRPS